jgi:hypothetical protein
MPVGTTANFIGHVGGMSFDVSVTPTVTAGAYSGGDIVGGLLAFEIGRIGLGISTLQQVMIAGKSAVSPTWSLHLFSGDPTNTTKTDNAAYSLATADTFLWRDTVTGFTQVSHGTPRTWQTTGLGRVMRTDSNGRVYGLLVDAVGVTLTSTSDLQVRLTGFTD